MKSVSAAAVVKRVEHDLDLVVIVNIFAARHACAYLLGVIEADEDCVEVFLVVAEISVGAFGSGLAIRRLVLNES